MALSNLGTIVTALALLVLAIPAWAVKLGVSPDSRHFTLDGKPVFLLGISYYSGTSVPNSADVKADLDETAEHGFNWIRVWANWAVAEDFCAVAPDGSLREPYMSRLKTIIKECDRRGMVVDVTMNRGKLPNPSNLAEHLAEARTLARELKPFRNVYIDVGNERDVGDSRHVPMSEVGALIAAIKEIDPERLCTASGVPGSQESMQEYLNVGHCDFVCPHLGRDPESPAETIAKVREMIGWMGKLGKRVPVHLQEPFRRDYAGYQPTAVDFFRDVGGGKIGGAAGWCFHNGSSRTSADHKPHRSFLMTAEEGRLFKQLDPVDREVCKSISERIGGTSLGTLRFQAEFAEQVGHEIGSAYEDSWRAVVGKDKPGYLTTGPVLDDLPKGRYRATWRVMVGGAPKPEADVAVVEVRSGGEKLAGRTLRMKDIGKSGTWNDVSVEFAAKGGAPVEVRTLWKGACDVSLDRITLEMGR